MSMLPLWNPILLRGVRAGRLVKNARGWTERFKIIVNVLRAIISPKNLKFRIELSFNHWFKMLENRKDFSLMFEKKQPSKPWVIINKNYIIVETKERSEWRRTLNITMHKFKKRSWTKRCFIQMKSVHFSTYTKLTRWTNIINLRQRNGMKYRF